MNPELERKVEAIEFRVKVVPEVAQHMVNVAGELNTTLLLKAKDIEGLSTALKEAYELGQLAEIEANATADITIAKEKVEQIREEAYELGRKEALANVGEWVKKRQEVWSDYYEDGEYVPKLVVRADKLIEYLD